MNIGKHKTDKITSNFSIEVHRLIGHLYEEAQDEHYCLYWQAAEMLKKFIDRTVCYQCNVGGETFATLDKRVAEEWSEDFQVTSILLDLSN